MFILSELQDIVRIEPRRFSQDTGQEIADELNRKFANKVGHLSLLWYKTTCSLVGPPSKSYFSKEVHTVARPHWRAALRD